MKIMGLDLERSDHYAHVFHEQFAHNLDPEITMALTRELQVASLEKKACPASDMISRMWEGQLVDKLEHYYAEEVTTAPYRWSDGQVWETEEEVAGVAKMILGAGVDTTTNTFANAAIWLAQHPEERQRLIDSEDLWSTALEEFFRYFSTVVMLGRTATKDTDLFGHDVQEGDRVLISFLGANHDPRAFDRPDEVVLDRWPNRHMTFGVGLHRCLGSHLARVVFPVMLRELLERAPEYTVVESELERYEDCAIVNGWASVPCKFTPASVAAV
jgi:cytochrome P450